MFGYVRIRKDELKMKDYNTYKAVYCSLCRELGKDYGLPARLTLNYDFTFLAILRLALAQDEPGFADSRCALNPLVKCKKYTGAHSEFSFVTAAAMIIFYYKLLDNIADEQFSKRVVSRLLKLVFHNKYKKAVSRYPELAVIAAQMAQRQTETEQNAASLDACAHPTADALAQIFALGSSDNGQKEILHRLGYCLGRYVYFIDALDDYQPDQKKGAFNAFASTNGIPNAPEVIRHSIGEAVRAYYLLTPCRYDAVLENILTKGLNNTLMQVLGQEETKGRADAI